MQPNIIKIDDVDYRIYTDAEGVNHSAAGIETFALRRVFYLRIGTSKIVDFEDLHGFWLLDSLYISSPEDSEITIEILNQDNVVFYTDKLQRNQTPFDLPTILINSTLKIKLTASRSRINLLLIYLKPAHLAYSKDF